MTKYFNKEKIVTSIIQQIGNAETPDTTAVIVIEKDGSGYITKSKGTTVPSAEAGYAPGSEFVDTNAASGVHKTYINIGDETTCNFDLVGSISSDDIEANAVDFDALDAKLQGGVGVQIYNDTGVALTVGQLVHVAGYDGVNGQTAVLADANSASVLPATHVVTDEIANGATGIVYKAATVGTQNTNGQTIGDAVYLSTTAGAFTFTAPTGDDEIQQQVGVVKVVDAAAGEIDFYPGNVGTIKKLGSQSFQSGAVSNFNEKTVSNTTGSALTPGTTVYIAGHNGSLPTVAVADNTVPRRAEYVVKDQIENGQSGTVYRVETVTGLNTDSFGSVGDPVYLGAAGAFETAKSNFFDQEIGRVKVKDATIGEIYFYPSEGEILEIPADRVNPIDTNEVLALYGGANATGYLYISGNGSDGETVVVGLDTFELDNDASFTGIQVDISGDNTPTGVATALVTAINANSADANAIDLGGGVVGIISTAPGDVNLALTETMANASFQSTQTEFGRTISQKAVYGSYRVLDALDITITDPTAANGKIVVGGINSDSDPREYSVQVYDTTGKKKAIVDVLFNWEQVNSDKYVLTCKETGAASELASGDKIVWIAIKNA